MANRDLKLENLLLDRPFLPASNPILKICDFGYSKVLPRVGVLVLLLGVMVGVLQLALPRPAAVLPPLFLPCLPMLASSLSLARLPPPHLPRPHTPPPAPRRPPPQHELNSSAKTGVGTPIYMAPEVIFGGNLYKPKVGTGGGEGLRRVAKQGRGQGQRQGALVSLLSVGGGAGFRRGQNTPQLTRIPRAPRPAPPAV